MTEVGPEWWYMGMSNPRLHCKTALLLGHGNLEINFL